MNCKGSRVSLDSLKTPSKKGGQKRAVFMKPEKKKGKQLTEEKENEKL